MTIGEVLHLNRLLAAIISNKLGVLKLQTDSKATSTIYRSSTTFSVFDHSILLGTAEFFWLPERFPGKPGPNRSPGRIRILLSTLHGSCSVPCFAQGREMYRAASLGRCQGATGRVASWSWIQDMVHHVKQNHRSQLGVSLWWVGFSFRSPLISWKSGLLR